MTNSANPLFGRPVQALWLALRRFGNKNGAVMSSHVAMSLMLALVAGAAILGSIKPF